MFFEFHFGIHVFELGDFRVNSVYPGSKTIGNKVPGSSRHKQENQEESQTQLHDNYINIQNTTGKSRCTRYIIVKRVQNNEDLGFYFQLLLKMNYNEQQSSQGFLVPSSIPRILQSNRRSCALQPENSISNIRINDLSPKQKTESKEYTFEPKINSSSKRRRSVDKFVQDQEKYQQDRQRKLTEMREEITRWQDEEIRSVPQINSISKTRLSSSNEKCESVFERLSKEKPLKEVLAQSSRFSPNILQKSKQIQRQKIASDILYDDAKRRQNKQRCVSETEEKRINTLSSPKINPNTNDLVRRKILSEFMNLISDEVMNPLLALSVLEELFHVKLRDISSPSVRKIVELIANKKGEVLTEKLWSFVAVIIGNGVGCFPQEEENEIKTNYGYFYKQRISKQRKSPTPEIPKFQPKISQNSAVLAEKYRQKLCKRASEFITHEKSIVCIQNQTIALEDLFIIEHQQRKKENQRLKIEKENLEIQQCTFKPSISPNKPTQRPKQKIVLKHSLRQKKSHQEPDITERIIPELKRVEREQTQRICLSNEKKAEICRRNRRSVENLSIRMSMGRIQKDLMTKMTQRGYEKDKNWMQEKMRNHKLIVENSKLMKGLREY